ncbi:hypothetical protein [Mycobacteroides abscessus]|nr:hypothetical protein D2E80_19755 [Mycobacteroides abscessus]
MRNGGLAPTALWCTPTPRRRRTAECRTRSALLN